MGTLSGTAMLSITAKVARFEQRLVKSRVLRSPQFSIKLDL